MAAGAIPPPLFFERRRQFFAIGPRRHVQSKTDSVDHAFEAAPKP
jgi:hypothetical protein